MVRERNTKAFCAGQDDVVPDSEEERTRTLGVRTQRRTVQSRTITNYTIIEISSSEDEFHPAHSAKRPSEVAFEISQETPREDAVSPERDEQNRSPVAGRRNVYSAPRFRRVIESSSAEDSGDEHVVEAPTAQLSRNDAHVIDLTLSSSEPEDEIPQAPIRDTALEYFADPSSPQPLAKQKSTLYASLYASDDEEVDGEDQSAFDEYEDDGSILILDEPGTVRKPIRTISTPSQGPSAIPSRLRQTPVLSVSGQANAQGRPVKTTAESPLSTSRSTVSARKAPRTTKKALAQAEQARREAYARALFDELNEVVFGGGIPASTQLRWSNRLLTTAGKAKWHRSRDGAQTSEIELATKVLDCDERIRNTLSHEMCHLACWIINKNIKESHGNIFKGWAAKVMQVRPDIEVSTRHSYEIAYKFEWKCENCAKVYGRHTKSIRPDECVCGGCRAGRLIPLFETPRRTPQTPTKNFASSQLSASRGRKPPLQIVGFASPLSNMVDPSGKNPAQSGSRLTKPQPSSSSILVISSDEDSDVEVLTHGLKTVMIRDGGNM